MSDENEDVEVEKREVDALEELEREGLVEVRDYEDVEKKTIGKINETIKENRLNVLSSQLKNVQGKLEQILNVADERSLTKIERERRERLEQKIWEVEKNIEEVKKLEISEEQEEREQDTCVEDLVPRISEIEEVFDDDGNEESYLKRISCQVGPLQQLKIHEEDQSFTSENEHTIEGGYKILKKVYCSLFEYQKKCIYWLWDLYCRRKGGIVGDEMGLGKTVQIVSYLSGLDYSNLISKPILIVCPVTVIHSWVQEFHKWWPQFRVSVLHSSGSAFKSLNKKRTHLETDTLCLYEEYSDNVSNLQSLHLKKLIMTILGREEKQGDGIVDLTQPDSSYGKMSEVSQHSDVFVTSYATVRACIDVFMEIDWEYSILDEGHFIRNPDTETTQCCKKLKTKNRLILTGTPIQNNLIELWSLYDYIIPGMLGTLPTFKKQFSIPINLGCYPNASYVQKRIAQECAQLLKSLISPFLLIRLKVDVAKSLPNKMEKIIYCKLTEGQIDLYQEYIEREMHIILSGKRHVLCGIDTLRKICNHPDLLQVYTQNKYKANVPPDYGCPEKSGKMMVLKKILKDWVHMKNKALIFSQTIQMLDIIEKMLISNKYTYMRLDGNTPLSARHKTVTKFNIDQSVSFLILSTRVGGIGLNLVGANRVLIYDPDWNPSSDMQAKERSWRIGQSRDVVIYRMITKDTLEEKIYSTQTFKHYLANQILKKSDIASDKNKVYKFNNLMDLFMLGDTYKKEKEENIGYNIKHKDTSPVSSISDEDIPRIKSSIDNTREQSEREQSIVIPMSLDNILNSLKEDNIKVPKHMIRSLEKEADLFSKSTLTILNDESNLISQNSTSNNYLPTWTGVTGIAGKPQIKQKNSCNYQGNNASWRTSQTSYCEAIKKRLIYIIKSVNSSCSTDYILKSIGSHVNERNAHLIKRALNEIAKLNSATGTWTLKKDS